MKKLLLLLYTIFHFVAANSQSGKLDASFANNGIISTSSETKTNQSFSILPRKSFVLPDGKIIMVLESNNKVRLTRLLANGTTDITYGTKGYSKIASQLPLVAVMQADGKIVTGGMGISPTQFTLVRFNTDGTLDPAYGNSGVVNTTFKNAYSSLNAMVLTSEGKVIAGGSTVVNGVNQSVMIRYTTAGSIDNTFGTNGFVYSTFNGALSSIGALTCQPDNKIVAAGNGSTGYVVARFDANGNPDPTFNGNGQAVYGISFLDLVSSIIVGADGRIYVGGNSFDAEFHFKMTILCFTSTGQIDPAFNSGLGHLILSPGPTNDFLRNLGFQSDGKIIVAGHTNADFSDSEIRVVRINKDGAIDNSFGPNGTGSVTTGLNTAYDENGTLSILPGDRIFLGGYNSDFSVSPNQIRFSGIQLNADGLPDANFGVNGISAYSIPGSFYQYTSVYNQIDEKILAISQSNGTSGNRNFIKRFNADGSVDSSYTQNGTYELGGTNGVMQFEPDGKILKMESSLSANGDFDLSITRHNSDGTIDLAFGNEGTVITDLGSNESGYTAGFQSDGKIIIGGLTRDNSGSDFLLVRFNYNGTIDPTFGNGGFIKINSSNEDQVVSIKVEADGKIIFSGMTIDFPTDFSLFRIYGVIGRLNSNGTLDTNFGTNGLTTITGNGFNSVGDFVIQNDFKIVFTRTEQDPLLNSQQIFVSRLNNDGTLDNSFLQSGIVTSYSYNLIQQTDGKIINVGYNFNEKNNADYFLSRINPDGSADPSFGNNGVSTGALVNLDNTIYGGVLAGSRVLVFGLGIDDNHDYSGLIARFNVASDVSLSCTANKTVGTDNNLCSAIVSGIDPVVAPSGTTVKYTLSGATTGAGTGSVSGLKFNKGVTTVTYKLPSDTTKSCSFTVTVNDNQAPTITNLIASPNNLWPANHKFRDILLTYAASDNCGITNKQMTITSNEPVTSNDPEDQSPDWQIIDNTHIKLRAERLRSGKGRIYTIKITVKDASGNITSSNTTVTVPKSQGTSTPHLQVTVSPNPSCNYFTVKLNSDANDKITIRIYNDKGVLLNKVDNINANSTIKLGQNLRPGIYFIEAAQAGAVKSVKVIKF